jgi:hypothetical protein
MHVVADAEITPILFLNSSYVGVYTLLAELTVFITATIAAHSRCILRPNLNIHIFLFKRQMPFFKLFCNSPGKHIG